jgi:hypothetical protein
VNLLRRIRDALWLHAGQIALVIACAGIAAGILANNAQTSARIASDHGQTAARIALVRHQRYVNAVSQVRGNRQGCRETNTRYGNIMAGIRTIATRAHTEPHEYLPLTRALSPRNCTVLYPMPNRDGRTHRGNDHAGLHFTSCRQAEAAGVTRIYDGQPGYTRALDPDGDGVDCG